MTITFSNNPIDKFLCWKDNEYEKFTHWYWNRKRHNVRCHICGKVLDSSKTSYSPEECGWVNIGHDKWSRREWICHMCDAHRNFPRYIKLIDLDEEIEYCSPRVLCYPWEKVVDERNQILKEIQDDVFENVKDVQNYLGLSCPQDVTIQPVE